MRQVAAVLEDLQLGGRQMVQPEVGRLHRWGGGVPSPGQPRGRLEPRQGPQRAVVEIAAQIGGQGGVRPRLMAQAVEAIDGGGVGPLGGGERFASQVMGQAGAAGVEIQGRGPQHRQPQQPVDEGVLDVGLVAVHVEAGRHDEAQGADQLGSVGRHLRGVGGAEARSHHRGSPAHHVLEEVQHQADVELAVVVDAGLVGAPPAEQVGHEDGVALGQELRRRAPLLAAVPGPEGVQQNDRLAVPEELEPDLAVAPGIAVRGAPAGRRQPPAATRDEGVGEGRDADRGAAQQQALEQPFPAPSLLFLLGSPGRHGPQP